MTTDKIIGISSIVKRIEDGGYLIIDNDGVAYYQRGEPAMGV